MGGEIYHERLHEHSIDLCDELHVETLCINLLGLHYDCRRSFKDDQIVMNFYL